MTTTPPCAGRWDLFDSTDVLDHEEARALCETCPMLSECAARLRETRQSAVAAQCGPEGTWAGELVGVGRIVRSQRLLLAQDEKWTNRDTKDAHNAYAKGDRSNWAIRGHRIYNRRHKAKKRAAEMAAA